jgi:hypothetical protein
MSRNSRESTGKQALAARISAQFDHALAQAAETMESFGVGWDDIGQDDGTPEEPDCDFLPLEFQLADLERAVDTMLQERDRFLYGDDYANQEGEGGAPPRRAILGKGS